MVHKQGSSSYDYDKELTRKSCETHRKKTHTSLHLHHSRFYRTYLWSWFNDDELNDTGLAAQHVCQSIDQFILLKRLVHNITVLDTGPCFARVISLFCSWGSDSPRLHCLLASRVHCRLPRYYSPYVVQTSRHNQAPFNISLPSRHCLLCARSTVSSVRPIALRCLVQMRCWSIFLRLFDQDFIRSIRFSEWVPPPLI